MPKSFALAVAADGLGRSQGPLPRALDARGPPFGRLQRGVRFRCDLTQLIEQLRHALIALRWCFAKSPCHDLCELPRDAVSPGREQRRVLVQDGVGDCLRMLPPKRKLSRNHLVEHHAQRPDVRPQVHGLGGCLLRRHVGNRAQSGPGAGKSVLAHKLRETEVDDLDSFARGDHEIGRLDVSMHDLVSMGLEQALGYLSRDGDGSLDRERTASDVLLQGLPVVVRHRDEHPAVLGLVDLVNRADVRMVERRGGFGFEQEAFAPLDRASLCMEKFQGDFTTEGGILGEVHFAHAPGPEPFENSVVAQFPANHDSLPNQPTWFGGGEWLAGAVISWLASRL